jgi:aldose 1-epimerase
MLEYNDALIPTGKTVNTENWVVPTTICDTQLDHGYLLDLSQAQPLCRLTDPGKGVAIEFHPDRSYPYLQLYTPPHRHRH